MVTSLPPRVAGTLSVVASGVSAGVLYGIVASVIASFTALGMLGVAIAGNNRARRAAEEKRRKRDYRRGRRDYALEHGMPLTQQEWIEDDDE
jgi:hypothetical protein